MLEILEIVTKYSYDILFKAKWINSFDEKEWKTFLIFTKKTW